MSLAIREDPASRTSCRHTRRQRRQQHPAEVHRQPATENPTRAHVTRRSRPLAHADMLTVAIGGHSSPRGTNSRRPRA
jgi:hypothetical protein